jgi:hypothetical protein
MKAFFGVHNDPDLNENRVRTYQSIEMNTSIQAEHSRAPCSRNVRKRHSSV